VGFLDIGIDNNKYKSFKNAMITYQSFGFWPVENSLGMLRNNSMVGNKNWTTLTDNNGNCSFKLLFQGFSEGFLSPMVKLM